MGSGRGRGGRAAARTLCARPLPPTHPHHPTPPALPAFGLGQHKVAALPAEGVRQGRTRRVLADALLQVARLEGVAPGARGQALGGGAIGGGRAGGRVVIRVGVGGAGQRVGAGRGRALERALPEKGGRHVRPLHVHHSLGDCRGGGWWGEGGRWGGRAWAGTLRRLPARPSGAHTARPAHTHTARPASVHNRRPARARDARGPCTGTGRL